MVIARPALPTLLTAERKPVVLVCLQVLVMPAILVALHPHAEPAKRARSKNLLAMMQHALLALWVSRRPRARPRERRLEVNAVRVPLDTLVPVSVAPLDAPSVHSASSR